MQEIRLYLTIDKVNKLCAICESFDCDVNVMCGRVCVDGRSVMGVAQMVGRVITLVPVTGNDAEWHGFFNKVKELGAYTSEGFFG